MKQVDLFPPQKEVIQKGLLDRQEHLLLNMATGTGKTYLAEMAIEGVLQAGFKALYLTPLRAIASEQYDHWKQRFPHTKIGVFTGETLQQGSTGSSYSKAQILIMTPERFDACMRNWRSHWNWIPDLSLLVIDEFHILGQGQRGARLEGTISRIIRLNPFVRIIGLSATMPNTRELSDWLHGASFSSQWRQVPIQTRIVRFKAAKEKPTLLLTEVKKCIQEGGQSLVFCNSRSRTESIAGLLSEAGIPTACHHAGLEREKRKNVEDGFRRGDIRVLVATSTLEMGLNLPARQVVIYDSYSFNESGFTQLPVWSFIQRAGRSGRPGQDEKGEAILMLPRWGANSDKYIRGECEKIESQLVSKGSMQEQILIDVFAGYSRTREELELGFLPITLYKKQHPEANINGAINKLVLADLLTENEDSSSGERILRCCLLGRMAVKLMLAPESVKLIKDAYLAFDRLYFFDLLLLSAMTSDCSPILQANYEEMDVLCERIQSRQSSLLSLSIEKLRKKLPDAPHTARILGAIKMAAICYALTEGTPIEVLAEQHDIYTADIRMLKDSIIRILLGITAITSAIDKAKYGEDVVKEKRTDPEYTPNLSTMLANMLQYKISSKLVQLTKLKGVGGKTAKRLAEAGFDSLHTIGNAKPSEIALIPGVGKKQAESMVSEARELLLSISDVSYEEETYVFSGKTRGVVPVIDPYRLRRSLELSVKGSDGNKHYVTGGRDDHIVVISEGVFRCDCMDHEKNGGECKHILCVKRAFGDPEICEMVKRIKEDKNHSIRETLPSLWYANTSLEG